MKSIVIVTATRAEYGILTPLIRAVEEDEELELKLIVTGAHLSDKYGNTESYIEKDGFSIECRIPILDEGNTSMDISFSVARAVEGFAKYFSENKPDMVVILGDRTEMLGVAIAAMNELIPIAHIHGGEITQGAVDDSVRHALTKMSYLHFASTDVYKNRIIQLGESPDRVYNVGALSTENILNAPILDEKCIRQIMGIKVGVDYAVVTFHPVTLEKDTARFQVLELCKAMKDTIDMHFVVTMANADAGGDIINHMIKEFSDKCPNISFVANLGMVNYLSAVKYAKFVLGNSSSGIVEAPVLGTPTVNIGDRQAGRLMAETIVNCEPAYDDIIDAIDKVMFMEHTPTFMYGDGKTSCKIVEVIKKTLASDINIKKTFYDMS